MALSASSEGTPASLLPPGSPAALEAAWRRLLEAWWSLTAEGPAAEHAAIVDCHQEICRIQDELGEPRATMLRRRWARERWQETKINPWPGGPEAPEP